MMDYNFIKPTLIVFFIFFFTASYSQVSKIEDDKTKIVNLFKKSKSLYDKNNKFEMGTTYNLYLGNSSKAVENYIGLFVKNNKDYYSKIGDTEFVLINGTSIKIDNESKLMMYFKDNDKPDELVYDLVKYCENFGTFNLKSTPTHWICTLNSREVTFIPFSKIVVYLNKTDFSIKKQELFMVSQVATKDANKKEIFVYPKLEIVFSEMRPINPLKDYFKFNNYFEVKKGKYYPVKKYTDYQIVD